MNISEKMWFRAAIEGQIHIINEGHEIHLRKKNSDDDTALMIAVKNNHLQIVKKLVQFENCEQNDQSGQSALMMAVHLSKIEMIKVLAPYEMGLRDCDGKFAFQMTNNKIIKQLLKMEVSYSDPNIDLFVQIVNSRTKSLRDLLSTNELNFKRHEKVEDTDLEQIIERYNLIIMDVANKLRQ